ncbi:MAG: BREX-1 system adenine-specific DNA-methyltransferase PglX, partial [Anaerolineaceae bacterium]|nr:BREX-1 system adenine-specific DNA-methyltransferase PglX [Anaerolineaceae bacterium]
YSGFEGATVPICTFTLENKHQPDFKGSYIRLSDFRGAENQAPKTLEAIANPDCGWFFRASAADFKKIPGSPIAYWVSERVKEAFENGVLLGEVAEPRQGLATAKNDRFLRLWFEVAIRNVGFDFTSREDAKQSRKKWFPYNKGGEYRRWYGNNDYLVNWKNDGEDLNAFKPRAVIRNPKYYFRQSITWSFVSSSYFGVRYSKPGAIFDVGGSSVFPDKGDIFWLTGFMCSKLSTIFMKAMNPTLNFQVGNVASLPIVPIDEKDEVSKLSQSIIAFSQTDWDSFETSWDFTHLPLLKDATLPIVTPLINQYQALRADWQEMTAEMQRLEEENNRIFIEAYDLQEELTPDVPLKEITLTCNPHYRYPDSKRKQYTNEEREAMLLEDTMQEFLSYAVGCMFGRYSLDKPGLVLANQGETVEDYVRKISLTPTLSRGEREPDSPRPLGEGLGVRAKNPTFLPDEDNVIPVLNGDWFPDDVASRFKAFLKVTFGEAHYDENLAFIEEALGRDVRSYFLKDFYKDHTRMYKKRPIYWLFSSPKGSFNALIYMHRYQPDTLSVLLNTYLREYQSKLRARRGYLESVERNPGASKRDKTSAQKEMRKIDATLSELRDYENDVIYPLATEQIRIDLDDGVKVNYARFGKALKGI